MPFPLSNHVKAGIPSENCPIQTRHSKNGSITKAGQTYDLTLFNKSVRHCFHPKYNIGKARKIAYGFKSKAGAALPADSQKLDESIECFSERKYLTEKYSAARLKNTSGTSGRITRE